MSYYLNFGIFFISSKFFRLGSGFERYPTTTPNCLKIFVSIKIILLFWFITEGRFTPYLNSRNNIQRERTCNISSNSSFGSKSWEQCSLYSLVFYADSESGTRSALRSLFWRKINPRVWPASPLCKAGIKVVVDG